MNEFNDIDFIDFRESVIDLYDIEEDQEVIQEVEIDLYDTVKDLRFFISDLTMYKALIKKSLKVTQERKLSRMLMQLQSGTSELRQYDNFLLDSTQADINPVLAKIVKAIAIILDILDEIQEEEYFNRKLELIETGEQLAATLSNFNVLERKSVIESAADLINY